MLMLEGKIVIVTGGASGIGRGIAVTAARHGAKLVVIGDLQDTPREGGESTVDAVRRAGAEARFCTTDVTRVEDCNRLVAEVLGDGGVDVMACNAGILLDNDGADVSIDDYRRLMSVNVDGVLFSAQAAAAQMQATGKRGSIILTSSIGGIRGYARAVSYSASKGAVRLLTASLADALGPQGIRVNAVCPGFIATQMLASGPAGNGEGNEASMPNAPLRRLGEPAEIGEAVCWLGSDLSSYVTGVALPVDGGLSSVIY
jgi:L-rhamnose 1-dehydrogenase